MLKRNRYPLHENNIHLEDKSRFTRTKISRERGRRYRHKAGGRGGGKGEKRATATYYCCRVRASPFDPIKTVPNTINTKLQPATQTYSNQQQTNKADVTTEPALGPNKADVTTEPALGQHPNNVRSMQRRSR